MKHDPVEIAYRRGFHQGVAQLTEALEGIVSDRLLDEIRRHERACRSWRSGIDDIDDRQIPPRPLLRC